MQRLIKFKFIKKFRLNKIQLIIGFLFLLIIIIISQRTLIYKYTDTFLKNLGFLLTEINISGISKLNENEIKTHIKYKNCGNLFCINLTATKSSLEQLAWVKSANLRLIMPSKLKIKIKEDGYKGYIKNNNFPQLLKSTHKVSILKSNIYKFPDKRMKINEQL